MLSHSRMVHGVISATFIADYTLCLKKRTNFETVYLKIIKIDSDDIWQKYSKSSTIEFVCFSFRVGLLLY